MGRPQKVRDGQDTRVRIVESATSLFAHNCYDETSMTDIGRELGISGAALYYHFKSKTDLLYHCLETCLKKKIDQTEAAMGGHGRSGRVQASEILRKYVFDQMVTSLEAPEVALWFDIIMGVGRVGKYLTASEWKYLQGLEAKHHSIIANVIVSGVESGEFAAANSEIAASAIVGMCNQVPRWAHPRSGAEIHEIATEYAQTALKIVSAGDENLIPVREAV